MSSFDGIEYFSHKNGALMEADHKARVEVMYHHFRRIYEANPHLLPDEFQKTYEASMALMDQSDPPLGWGITINPGNTQILEDRDTETMDEFQTYFLTPFTYSLDKKYSISDWYFTVEEAPQTRRLHLHGRVVRKPTKQRVYPCDIQLQIWQCLPGKYQTIMNKKHIVVEPIYNKKKWDSYISKNPIMTISKSDDLEIKKIKKTKNKNKK